MEPASNIVRVNDLDLPFLLSTPREDHPSHGLRPVLVFLHGLDEGPPTEIATALRRHGPLNPNSSPLARDQFLVAAPQLPARGDLWNLHAESVAQVVRHLHERYGGDPARTYLTGFSFGGNGVFDLALAYPDIWAALWAVDPTRVPPEDLIGIPIWISIGEVARYSAQLFRDRLRLQTRDSGGDRIFTDEGLDHVGTAAAAYREDQVYRWLLGKKRG